MTPFHPRLLELAAQHAEPTLRLFIPSIPTPTCQDAAIACQCSIEQIIKTVILCGKNKSGTSKEYVAVVLRGCDQIDQNAVRRMINCQKISFASSEETIRTSGFAPGGIPPIGLNDGLKVFIETRVLNYPTVIGGGGDEDKLIEIDPRLIMSLNQIDVANDFAK